MKQAHLLLISGLALCLLGTFAPQNSVHAMSATNVQPANLIQSNKISNTITFTNAVSIPTDGKIKILYPISFDVSGATNGSCSSMNGGFSTSVSGQTVTITRTNTGTTEISGAQTCTIQGIRNPSSTGSTGTYTIQITNSADTILDQDTAVTADTIATTGTITVSNVQTENQIAGTKSRATVTYTSINTLAHDGMVSIIFPSGFNVAGVTSSTCTTMDGSFSVSTSSQTVTIIRNGSGTNQAAAAESCLIDGIIAPTSTGATGTYTIQTKDSLGNITDSGSVAADIYYASTSLSATNVQPASLVAGAQSVATITFTTATSTPIDGKFRVTFPSGFSLSPITAVACASISGSVSFTTSSNSLLISRTGNGSTEAAGVESCTATNIRNPQISGSAGTYSIEVLDSQSIPVTISSDLAVTADTITAGALTGADIIPENLVASTTQAHNLVFTTANPIPADGKIIVTYPTGFSLNSAQSATCFGLNGSISVSTSGQSLILTRSGGTDSSAGAVDCLIENITNRGAGASGIYSVSTTNAGSIVIDQASATSDTYVAPVTLTLANVQPVSLVRNVTTDHDITFTISQNIPKDGKIQITYGAGYDILDAHDGTCTGFDGTITTATSSQTVTFSRSGGSTVSSGAKVCRIYGIMNSSSTGSTLPYTIAVTDKNGVLVGSLASVTADTITAPGVLTGADVQPNSLSAGATTSITTVFGSTSGIPHDGKVAVTFPSGFYLGAANTPICAGLGGGFTLSVSGTNQVILTRDQSSTGTTSFSLSCVFSGIKNPSTSGAAGSYLIATTDEFNVVIATSSVSGDTFTTGNISSATIQPDTLVISATNTYSANFTAFNPIPANGKLAFIFPSGINLSGVSSTAISCSGIDGTLSTSIAGQTATALRIGGTTTTENAILQCTLRGIRNSTSAGTFGNYSFRTTNFSDVIIDQNTSVPSSTFAVSGTISGASITPSSVVTNASPSYTLTFSSTLGFPRDGKIDITFPAGINISAASISSCTGLTGATATTSGQILRITQTNATSRSVGSVTCVFIGIINPSTSGNPGSYSLKTLSADELTLEEQTAISGQTFSAPVVTSNGGGGGGGGGSSIPFTTPTYQTSNDAFILKQISDRLAKLPVSQHSLIKLADDGDPSTQQDSAVYYVGSDGLRHAFSNSKTYFSWYCDFSQVRNVSPSELASIGLGRNIPYRSGTKLVKFTTDPKVYLVIENAILRAIPDEQTASKLFGTQWNKNVDDISDAFYLDYTFGSAITATENILLENLRNGARVPSDSLRILGYISGTNPLLPTICTAPITETTKQSTTQTTTKAVKRPASIPTDFTFTKDLSLSAADPTATRYLQMLLIALGSDIFPEARVTGNYGPATEAAIRRFQARKINLTITGIVDEATRVELNKLLK